MPYAEPLSESELADALARLPGWRREGATLVRTFELGGFTAAIALVNAVADAAILPDLPPYFSPSLAPAGFLFADKIEGLNLSAPRFDRT